MPALLRQDTLLAVRVEEDKDGYLKIKSPDKAAAREQLMKHLGMFERDNKQKPAVGINLIHQPGFRSVEFDPIPLTRKG